MNKSSLIILFFLIFSIPIFADESGCLPGEDCSSSVNGGIQTGSGTSTSSDWPSDPTLNSNSQIHVVGNAKVVDSTGLVENGNAFSVSSASNIYTGGFVFNDVGSTSIVADENKLLSASVTSSKDGNRFVIKNPLDPLEIEKINIYLNASQSITYSFDNENVTITIPESSRAIIAKGSKNITVEPNGPTATIRIDNSKIIGAKGEVYDKPQYTITGANLTYQNKDIIERLITAGETRVRIDTDKGFGYMLLNGQTQILPGDTYEYYDLQKKEKSYSLYNNGQASYEYGFLKGGFIYELLSVIAPTAINYGFEGSSEITLKGIIEYKRMQSYDQLKAIAGTYANYNAMQLPFLTVYSSNMSGNEYKISGNIDFNASQKYDGTVVGSSNQVVSLQNNGYYSISLATHSPLSYYIKLNNQQCPDYIRKTIALPGTKETLGELTIINGTLKFRNFRIYSPGTDDYNNFMNKLNQLIITSTPEKYGMVNFD